MLFHPDPLPPRFIGHDIPQLDLHLLVVDRRLHRRATHVRTVTAPRVAVATFQDDVDRLIRALRRIRVHVLHQVFQMIRSGLRLLAGELLGRVHRA